MDKIKLNAQLMTEEMKRRLMYDVSVYDEIDIEAGIPYILHTWKIMVLELKERMTLTGTLPAEVKTAIKEWNGYPSPEDNKATQLSYVSLWKHFKDKGYPKEALQYLLDEFVKSLHPHLMQWGFGFLDEVNFKAELK